MGLDKIIWCSLLLYNSVVASPHFDTKSFLRSAVETVPQHEAISTPIRSSVESIPLRSLRDEGDKRLPLRDAVERRPISLINEDSYKMILENEKEQSAENLRLYYGAAGYLNNGERNDERLHQGNANLQEMQQTSSDPVSQRLVVCYMESWAAYRSPPLAFTAGLVPKSCTHLHYAFAVMHPHTYAVTAANEDYDVIKGGYRIATGLKHRFPGMKVLISVGGDGTERLFSEMVQEPQRRSSFIDSAIKFLQEHNFDGLDLHWVYAGEKSDKDKEMLTSLLYELREKFSSYGFLISTVLPPFRYQIEDGYDLRALSGAADYVVLQAWDMTHGKRDEAPSKAVQHSALHRDPGAASRNQRYENIEFIVGFILRHGMSAEKLVLGVPLFGRSYTLAPSTLPAPGALVSDWGEEGLYTQTKGSLAYFEICMAEREGKGTSGVDENGNSYAIFGDQWVAYDTPSTVSEKMKFVLSSGLGGAAAWSIDMDDFRGLCGSPFPLLRIIATSLNGDSIQSDQSSLKIGSCDAVGPYLASDQESCAHFHFCSGGISYRMMCEEDRLYDPSTGFCGHQDVAKCIPGQSLRISVMDAARFLPEAYENDFEWSHPLMTNPEPVKFVDPYSLDIKKNKDNDKRVVCYMTSWAFYRRGDGKFVPENVDTRLCTHIVYAYASLSPDELIAKEFDPWADVTNNLYERVTSLKDVKVLLGLGGWTDSAGDKYSRLVSSGAARTKFTEKLVAFLRTNNFQGLHLDWNYPVCWQSNCKKGAVSDKANYAKLVQEVSRALHSAGMELGVALSGYKEVIESAYDLPALSKAADFLSTMTYDYHGGWERTTAHHTPLIPSSKDTLPNYSIEYAIKALLKGGADPKKLLLGLSFYGQSFRLAGADARSGPGTPAAGPGEPGEFTKQPGMLAYYEICYRVKNLRWKTGKQENAGPYAYSDNQWVGYDDPKSITEKVKWAIGQGLGGVTAWAIDLDDFSNRCCAEPSPLLRAAGRALGRAVPPPPTTACERPPEPATPAPPTTTTAISDGSGGSGDHGSHGHEHHTSTTWPSWTTPSTTSTTQTWWTSAATTTTTTRKPTTTSTKPSAVSGPCKSGSYRAVEGECDSYLQCEGGQWRKQRCAPGLHWAAALNRCDWPTFAKCTIKPTSEASTATSTLAPMTSRPPLPSTTTRPTTTTRATTTTRTTTTARTTTRTTTTTKPTTTTSAGASAGASLEGTSCSGSEYRSVSGNCNSYLHCDGVMWRLQNCAPGLHWSQTELHCDWPKYAKCEGSVTKPSTTAAPAHTVPPRPSKPPVDSGSSAVAVEDGPCAASSSHAAASSCDSYLLCVGGRWRKQLCPPGLHWDKRTNRCDWIEFAMCDVKPGATKAPVMDTTTTRQPIYTRPTSKKPVKTTPSATRCRTGTYHPHARCEKFYVCVNGKMVEQSCAPGLVWGYERGTCDFPGAASCSRHDDAAEPALADTMQHLVQQTKYCDNGEYATFPDDCTRYRHCLFGKFEDFACSPGLHWNQEIQICDWPKNAKCKTKDKHIISTPTATEIILKPKPTTKPQVTNRPPINLPETRPGLLNSGYKMVCYFTNWAWYRPGIGKYSPEDIDHSLCTHIVYGFAVLGDDGLITAHDTWADYDNRFYERVVDYKRYGIKVSLAVGGWNDSAGDKYSKLVNSPLARAKFVKHAVQFLEKYNFDGLDLDWEYPKCWQVDCTKGPDSDKDGFSDLIRELSAVLKPKGLLLSSAVSPNKKVIDEAYDVPVLSRYLDWIAVMTYDYHGHWDKKVGHVAPLYYYPHDGNTYFNANYTIHYWMAKGAPSYKLVMGVPLYGQSFTIDEPLKYSGDNAMVFNRPAIAGGEPGEYTRAKGFLAYYEICDRIKNRKWQVIEDPYPLRMGPIAFKDDQFVSYDNVEIIKAKVNFLKSLKLGGAMVWALDLDDFRNRCGEGKHPLMNAIKKELLNPRIDVESPRPVPIVLPAIPNEIDDLDDIEVRPGYTKKTTTTARPIAQTTQMLSTQTTKRPVAVASPEERYKVVCYYTNWAWYRPDSGKFTPSDIDPSLCTHIVYAFAVLDTESLVIKPHDTWLDVENMFFEKVVALKKRGLKVVLGLGGWNDSAGDKYSRLVNNPSARRKFIVHAVDFIKQYDFDGLDLDWEYPRCWQVNCEKGPSSDKQGFASLVKELRIAFKPHGLLLSAAVSASKRVIDAAYDVSALSNNLDWIALMTYDYHGQWDKKTGHVAPMYASENDEHATFNTNFTVHYWIDKGAARQKLVLGMPFYGQSFSLEDNVGTGLGVPTYAGGEAGDETRARGFLAFYEICERIRAQGWKVYRDPGGRIGPYATKEDQWVSFDDDFMVRHKAEYVRAMGLGGGMVWAMDLDDFTGRYCGCGNYPLLANINHVLRGHASPTPCQLMEIQAPTPATDVVTATSVASDTEHMHFKPAMNTNSGTLEGSSCAGVTFKADDKDCAKYYLCINGHYMPLNCPSPLLWNENHCDLPEKTRCKTKGLLRITAEENNQGEDFYDKPILACYFTNWAYYRQGEGRFGPEQVEASRCTHVVYSWAHLNPTSNELVPGNPELDIENDFFGKLTELRQKGIKMIIGAGGLEDSEDDKWSKMAADPRSREIFINSVLKFLRTWNFDGVQLAWQYPVCKQTPCKDETNHLADRDNFSVLLAELSRTLRDQNYEISVMVSANPEIASLAYEPYVLTLSADWISVAANDYYASNTGKTNYLISFENSDVPGTSSFNGSLAYWLSVVPAQQVVMGVPAYGRTYTLVHAHAGRAPGAAASGPGQPGPYTAVPGFLAYYEVCPSPGSGWQEMVTTEGTFAWRGLQWAAYVRPVEAHRVAASVRAVRARGAALWALDLDDWNGRCGCEARPLLAALRLGLLEPGLPPALCL